MLVAKKFRKKPVVIQAMQWDGSDASFFAINQWSKGNVNVGVIPQDLVINTRDGLRTASIGDWIVREAEGVYCAVKPDVFESTYEPE